MEKRIREILQEVEKTVDKALQQVIANQTRLLAQILSGVFEGDTFTTQSSGVTGIVKEVVANPTGTFRVCLDVNGVERWTTFKKELAQ